MLQAEYRDIKDLRKLEGNPRVIRDKQFKQLCESIAANGDYFEARPVILSDRTGKLVIIAGNQRYEAARHLGIKSIPTILIPDLTEEREREITIRDNVSNGEWDFEILANEWDTDDLLNWGFEIPDITVDLDPAEAKDDDYEVPDEIATDIVLGDLIEIGQHRLICGDSTEADVVQKLLEGKEPYLMVTDPPYGVVYDANWRNGAMRDDGKPIGGRAVGKVLNDDNADWTETWAISPAKVAYVWHAGRFAGVVQDSLGNCDFEIRSQIVWVKSNFAISRGDYHWKHEPCWYAVKKGNKGNWAGDRKQTTVWEIAKPQKSETGHSTQKPVECMARPIGNHDGDVYDPFLGSGTTMVAAHQLRRRCFGVELNPKYCQVIVDRMRKLDSALEIKRNGQIWYPEH